MVQRVKCDLCGSNVQEFSHSCNCGHGICESCHDEMKSRFILGFPQCFWWSCEFYGMVKIPETGQFEGITLNAQRFGALSGWTTELAEDSIIATPQLMFSELANAMAEQEELAMIQGDVEPLIPTPLADNLVERVEWQQTLRNIFDNRNIGERRRVVPGSVGLNHDIEEIRVTDRIAFEREYQNNPITHITDVNSDG